MKLIKSHRHHKLLSTYKPLKIDLTLTTKALNHATASVKLYVLTDSLQFGQPNYVHTESMKQYPNCYRIMPALEFC